jgi:hypothetical protein
MNEPERRVIQSEQLFFRIASGATAFALGVLLAAVASLQRQTGGFRLHFGIPSLVAFAAGAALGWVYWRIVAPGAAAPPRPGWVRPVASLLLALVGICAFVYPVRFLPRESLPEVLLGLVLAALALATGGMFLWALKRFLDRDTQRESERAAKNRPTVIK